MILDLPSSHLSRSKQMAGTKEWIKRLTDVDTSKQDGYAFQGTFEKMGATVEVPEGTWFLEYVEDRSGSGHLRGRTVTLYRVTPDGLTEIRVFNLDGSPGWALRCRDDIAGILADAAAPDPDALRAERNRLTARIAEIDTILGQEVTQQ